MILFEAAAAQLLNFPEFAPVEPRLAGARIARRKTDIDFDLILGKRPQDTRVEAVIGCEKRTIGKWFDGKWQQEVEFVWIITPNLIARWLGFLRERELWTEGTLDKRWDTLRNWIGNRTHFVVQLCAFPKVSLLELTEFVSSNTEDIDRVRFVVTVDGKNLDCDSTLLQSQTAYDRMPAMDYRWWMHDPWSRWLAPEFDKAKAGPYYPVGEYRCRWYAVECKLPPELRLDSPLSLTVLSPNKKRVASWSIANLVN